MWEKSIHSSNKNKYIEIKSLTYNSLQRNGKTTVRHKKNEDNWENIPCS